MRLVWGNTIVSSVLSTASFLACLTGIVAVGYRRLLLHNLFTSGASRKKESEQDLTFPAQEPQPLLCRGASSYCLRLVAFEIPLFLEQMKAAGSAQCFLLAG